MDLESHRRWYDYARARDAMFAATDTPESPWYVVNADDKRRARLNCIVHFLSLIPYEEIPREKVTLPPRQKAKGYKKPAHFFSFISGKILIAGRALHLVGHQTEVQLRVEPIMTN